MEQNLSNFMAAFKSNKELRTFTKTMIELLDLVDAHEERFQAAAGVGKKLEKQCSQLMQQLDQANRENNAMKAFIVDHVKDPVLINQIFRGSEGDETSDRS